MTIKNPTTQTMVILLGTEHGATPVSIFINPHTNISINLSRPQLINFNSVKHEIEKRGAIIQP